MRTTRIVARLRSGALGCPQCAPLDDHSRDDVRVCRICGPDHVGLDPFGGRRAVA